MIELFIYFIHLILFIYLIYLFYAFYFTIHILILQNDFFFVLTKVSESFTRRLGALKLVILLFTMRVVETKFNDVYVEILKLFLSILDSSYYFVESGGLVLVHRNPNRKAPGSVPTRGAVVCP